MAIRSRCRRACAMVAGVLGASLLLTNCGRTAPAPEAGDSAPSDAGTSNDTTVDGSPDVLDARSNLDGGSDADVSQTSDAGDFDAEAATDGCGAAVTFHLDAPGRTGCVVTPNCSSYEYADWVAVLDPGGNLVHLVYPCLAVCETCAAVGPCPAFCVVPTGVPSSGLTQTWDGTYYVTVDSGTCGSGPQCTSPRCAPPGHYTAVMCVTPDDADSSTDDCLQPQTCIRLPFDLPSAGLVAGVLPAADE